MLFDSNFTGIGASIAEGLTFNGMKVITCARRLEKLEEIAREGAFL
jgi:NADP-dependent 3-hydroxy acid dehydrogenase YdfG